MASRGHYTDAKWPEVTLPPLLAATGRGCLWRGRSDSTMGAEGGGAGLPPAGVEGVSPKRSGPSSGGWDHV